MTSMLRDVLHYWKIYCILLLQILIKKALLLIENTWLVFLNISISALMKWKPKKETKTKTLNNTLYTSTYGAS